MSLPPVLCEGSPPLCLVHGEGRPLSCARRGSTKWSPPCVSEQDAGRKLRELCLFVYSTRALSVATTTRPSFMNVQRVTSRRASACSITRTPLAQDQIPGGLGRLEIPESFRCIWSPAPSATIHGPCNFLTKTRVACRSGLIAGDDLWC